MIIVSKIRCILILLLTVTTASCAIATAREYFRKEGGIKRASFDLQCPEDQLELHELNGEKAKIGSQIGVRGCGKQAAYVFTWEAGWVANSTASEK